MLNYEEMKYTDSAPYPPVCVCEKNWRYGAWILDNLGGHNSEISAVSLYFYNNLIAQKSFPDISHIFHKISIVEMHHLEIFGQLAIQLGENPRLWTNAPHRKRYWTPGYNNYPTDLAALMNNALAGELAAIHKYEQQADVVKDENIAANLNRIILDEQIHVAIFRQIMEEYHLFTARVISRAEEQNSRNNQSAGERYMAGIILLPGNGA